MRSASAARRYARSVRIGQRDRANDRAARGGNSAKVGRGQNRLGQSEAVPVSVDQAIEVPVLDEVGVDHGDLLEPGTREAFEDDRTDATRADDADVGASQACLRVDAPAVHGAHQAWTAGVGRMRARSQVRARCGAARPVERRCSAQARCGQARIPARTGRSRRRRSPSSGRAAASPSLERRARRCCARCRHPCRSGPASRDQDGCEGRRRPPVP